VAQRTKLSGTLSTSPSGSTSGGASGELLLDFSGAGDLFDDVRQREGWRLATSGNVGAVFATLDAPATIGQLLLMVRNAAEVAVRLNGAVAQVVGTGQAFGTIAGGETLVVTVDQGTQTTVTFLAGDTTGAKVAARINAAVGAIVASVATDGNLALSGAKTGGASAKAKAYAYGSIEVGAGSTGLAKLGLAAGTTLGSGEELGLVRRLLLEPPTSGARILTRVELSGSADLVTHAAGF